MFIFTLLNFNIMKKLFVLLIVLSSCLTSFSQFPFGIVELENGADERVNVEYKIVDAPLKTIVIDGSKAQKIGEVLNKEAKESCYNKFSYVPRKMFFRENGDLLYITLKYSSKNILGSESGYIFCVTIKNGKILKTYNEKQ